MCTYVVKPRNYEVFARTAKKRTFLTYFGGVITTATADTPKLELRVCVKVKYVNRLRHVKSVHKMSGGGHKCAKTPIFDDFTGV